jgi:hypothetical protein
MLLRALCHEVAHVLRQAFGKGLPPPRWRGIQGMREWRDNSLGNGCVSLTGTAGLSS